MKETLTGATSPRTAPLMGSSQALGDEASLCLSWVRVLSPARFQPRGAHPSLLQVVARPVPEEPICSPVYVRQRTLWSLWLCFHGGAFCALSLLCRCPLGQRPASSSRSWTEPRRGPDQRGAQTRSRLPGVAVLSSRPLAFASHL